MLTKYAPALAVSLLLATPASAAQVTVEDPWIRAAPPGAPAMAGYMRITNEGEEVSLTGASAPGFGRAMLHRTLYEDGVATMARQAEVPLAGGETVRFEPGGLHIMLMMPQAVPAEGETVPVTLEFDDDTRATVDFPVRRDAP